MPELTCPVSLLIGDSPIPAEGIGWRIAAHPPVTVGATSIALGTFPRGGTVATGIVYGSSFAVRLGHTAPDAIYSLEFGMDGSISFQYRATDPAGWTIRDHAEAFRQRHPNGLRTEYVPTPGPAGRPGTDGIDGTSGTRGAQGNPGLDGVGFQGVRGFMGFLGPGDVAIFLTQATALGTPNDPPNTVFNVTTETYAAPAPWALDPTNPTADQTLWKSIAHVQAANADAAGNLTLSFSHAFEISETIIISRTGPAGDKGWSPVYGLVADGATRVVELLVAWHGGAGATPAGVGMYEGPAGLVATKAEATNVRGPRGTEGPLGPPTNTVDLILTDIGTAQPALSLPTAGIWVSTGIVVPAGVHMILVDASNASDDFHVVDWDTIIEDNPAVAGAVSQVGEFETFVVSTGLNHVARIGHTVEGEILLANDTTSPFNVPLLRVERLVGPPGPRGPQGIPGTGGGGGGVDYSFVQALPLHSVPREAQFIVARPGDEGGGDLVAAVPRAIFDRLHTDNPDRFLPAALEADRNLFVNAAGKIDFGPILNAHTIFPRSSVIPDHTADDYPELFLLDHPITTGPRDDATVVPGYWNFSPSIPFPTIGSASVGFTTYFTPHIGSLNRAAGSLAEIIGAVHEGDAHHDAALNITTLRPGGIFSQQQINSHSESWLRAWSTVLINGTEYATGAVLHSGGVWYRNILNFPDHLTGNFTLNFKNSSDEYYYTGAGRITTHPAGLYTWTSERLRPRRRVRRRAPSQGRGAPTELPDLPRPAVHQQPRRPVDRCGRVAQRAAATPPVRSTPLTRGPLAVGLYRRINAGTDNQFAVLVGNGGFSWAFFADFEGNSIFRQAQGPGGGDVVMTTFAHVWQYLNAIHPNDAQAARAHDHSIFLGVFTSHQDAFDRYDTRYTQALFDSGVTDVYYGIRTDDTNDTADPLGGIHQLTAFTAAHVTVDNSAALHWVRTGLSHAMPGLTGSTTTPPIMANGLIDGGLHLRRRRWRADVRHDRRMDVQHQHQPRPDAARAQPHPRRHDHRPDLHRRRQGLPGGARHPESELPVEGGAQLRRHERHHPAGHDRQPVRYRLIRNRAGQRQRLH